MPEEAATRASILVVDDTIENLRLLASMLNGQGYEVRPVTNGKQALAAIERDPPDLILLDISMPEMDGYEVCRRLMTLERCRDIPVIFLTAQSEMDSRVKAFNVGGVDYITKPFQLEEVFARIRTHLRLRKLQAELEERNRHLQENNARLTELEKLRDDLIHMVVHDMRSPLSNIQIRLDMLVADLPEGSLERRDMEAVRSSTRELVEMTRQLLDINRMEQRNMPLELAEQGLGPIAEQALAEMATLAEVCRVRLENRVPDVRARCDEAIVRRIFTNLLSNAIKHAPKETAVVMEAAEQGGSVRVSVSDRGPGIPLASRTRIFRKFEQLEARKNKQYHSVGLGLAFCRLAVEAHGGQIGVEDGVEQGSRFWFTLPAADLREAR
jgi:two-component system, sensor histidine kinase and response regulator